MARSTRQRRGAVWVASVAMCTRGVWQLRSLMLQYCNAGGSSSGVRKFAEQLLVPFAEANPQVQIAVSMKPNRHPFVRGYYVRDREKTLSLKGLSAEQVMERVELLRNSRPIALQKWKKPYRTSPSVQGEWELGQLLSQPHKTIRG